MAPVINTCERALIMDHLDTLRSKFLDLVRSREEGHLRRLYHLLTRVHSDLDPLRTQFRQQIESEGLSNMENITEEDDPSPRVYVSTLHVSITSFHHLPTTAFDDDAEFRGSAENAWRKVVNENKFCRTGSSRSAEILANHVNTTILELSQDQAAEAKIDASLDMIVSLIILSRRVRD